MYPSPPHPRRGIVVVRLREALERLGHEVRVEPLIGAGRAFRYLLLRRQVASIIKEFKPDIVHVHFGYSGLAVPRSGRPLITSFNGDDLNGTTARWGGITLKSLIGIFVSQYVAWQSDMCTAVSETLKQQLWLASVRNRTAVIRDAVDTRLFHPLDKGAARRRLGLEPDAVLILFPHDANAPNKRLPLAQLAVEQLREWEPSSRLLVVNDCPPDNMAWYYAAADAMIITSVREGGPSSAKEALACGLSVVSVDVGDRDLFREAPEAMTCVAPRPYDLAIGLQRAARAQRAPRKSFLPRWLELESTTRALLDVYRRALERTNNGRAPG
jgi:glycosyltransferase involved in cell wall biosynthesis